MSAVQAADELLAILQDASARMPRISEEFASRPWRTDNWSRKEILGHLIDSAANNHHRFVRAQFEANFAMPAYQQGAWVETQRYRDCAWSELVALWVAYNRYLVLLMKSAPADVLARPCRIGEDAPVTLEFLMIDYVAHLKHHVEQIFAAS
jgi:hypothetical protein